MRKSSEFITRLGQRISPLSSRLFPIILALTLVGLGGYFAWKTAWAAGPHGIGVDTDSVYYIWSSRNLANGTGLGRLDGEGQFIPMTDWPPFYPVLLSGFEGLGVGAPTGAHGLAVLLAGLNVFLAGLVLHRLTRSAWLSASGALMAGLSPVLVQTSLWALTEPLFICISLLAFLIFDQYLQKPARNWGVLLGVSLAAAFLTRYIGAALVGAVLLAVLLFSRGSFLNRIRLVMLPLAIAVLPMLAWLARNSLLAGTLTNRSFGYVPLETWETERLVDSLTQMVEPARSIFSVDATKLVLAIAAVLGFLAARRFLPPRQPVQMKPLPALFWALVLYELFYLAAILLSRLFIDPFIQLFLERIQAPLFMNTLILLLAGLYLLWSRVSNRSLAAGSVLLVIGVFGFVSVARGYASASERILTRQHTNGSGLFSEATEKKLLTEAIRQVPSSYVFFTDNIERLYYLKEQPCSLVFEIDEPTAQKIRASVQRKRPAAVVLFYTDAQRVEQVQQHLPDFSLVYNGNDGLVAVQPGD